MSQPGLFGWIRDGVRQSVLMGVSDAMEVMGAPQDPGQLHPALQSMAASTMQRIGSVETAAENVPETGSARINGERAPQRKRLGRSLKDMTPNAGSVPKSGS
ncbi:MAG: hypothetical protein MUF23_18050 [Pirellula sp.]|jgi:hypothetical protein|nr:hypothetical protein [Pirellula sp.]